ncbi:MAG: hypothetical protein HZB52_02775 [Chloroflexi bacterium]|nr:hypothetical protein [Chloroflexota bacterium]
MKILKAYCAALLFLILSSLACSLIITDANEQFLQGKWSQSGSADGFAWYSNYTFDRGSFTIDGYPPLKQSGSYRLVSSSGDTLVLEFYDQKGDLSTENSKVTITVDRAKDAISFDSGKTFYSRAK